MKRWVFWVVIWSVVAVAVGLDFYFTNPKPVTENVSASANSIFYDAKWYEVLWERWTIVDWLLSLLAAGTAITAAVKNAFSTHTQAAQQAQGNKETASPKIDRLVMTFAALTIVATTLDAKMHPAQMAERYRQGDLLLQDAIMDYRHSLKTHADEEALLNVWHQAQRILEGAPAVAARPEPGAKPEPVRPAVVPDADTKASENGKNKTQKQP